MKQLITTKQQCNDAVVASQLQTIEQERAARRLRCAPAIAASVDRLNGSNQQQQPGQQPLRCIRVPSATVGGPSYSPGASGNRWRRCVHMWYIRQADAWLCLFLCFSFRDAAGMLPAVRQVSFGRSRARARTLAYTHKHSSSLSLSPSLSLSNLPWKTIEWVKLLARCARCTFNGRLYENH